MSLHEPTIPTSNPNVYAHLPEDEHYSHNDPAPQNQLHLNDIQQGHPVIVQGVPVMGYPAHFVPVPMGAYDTYNPSLSPFQKLDYWPYQVFKYWVLLCIIANGLYVLTEIPSLILLEKGFALRVFSVVLSSWQVFQLEKVFSGIRRKDLEKIDRGIYLMKIYFVFKTIWEFVDDHFWCNEPGVCQRMWSVGEVTQVIVAKTIIQVIWYLVLIYPAIKIRNILNTERSSQTAH